MTPLLSPHFSSACPQDLDSPGPTPPWSARIDSTDITATSPRGLCRLTHHPHFLHATSDLLALFRLCRDQLPKRFESRLHTLDIREVSGVTFINSEDLFLGRVNGGMGIFDQGPLGLGCYISKWEGKLRKELYIVV